MKIYFILNGRNEYFHEGEDGTMFLKSKTDMTIYPSEDSAKFAVQVYQPALKHETFRIYEIDLSNAVRVD